MMIPFLGKMAWDERKSWNKSVSAGLIVEMCDPAGPLVLLTDVILRGVIYRLPICYNDKWCVQRHDGWLFLNDVTMANRL
jgi:hypothetical protein